MEYTGCTYLLPAQLELPADAAPQQAVNLFDVKDVILYVALRLLEPALVFQSHQRQRA
jgi:hypothetical protein